MVARATPAAALLLALLLLQTAPHLQAKSAMALVETSDGTGSGFAVTKTHVATNCHVIKGAAAIQVHFWTPRVRIAGRRAACDDQRDVAFIAVAVPEGVERLEFSADRPTQGQQIWVWGFPLGTTIASEPSLSQGIISATESQPGFIVLDAAGAPGSSGGPVVGADGKVVAIFTGQWIAGRQGPTGFKAAVTAASATEVLRMVGSVAPPQAEPQQRDVSVRPGDGLGSRRIGMTAPQAESTLGLAPSSRTESCHFWATRKLAVCYDQGKVFLILTQDPTDTAPQGIRIGATDVDLITAFGRPKCARISSFSGKAVLTWFYDGLGFWLEADPRRVSGLLVLSPGMATAVCR
jgi:hypothetical protein